jgi:predicted unusual protein kinase regulating ubiquinone biosynthesis (AarF/ABC1/UbiB family)
MVKPDRPDGAVSRSLRMARLGLSLTGSYLRYQFQNLFMGAEGREEQRRRFGRKASRQARQELELLKGPLMKFGQILSMQTHALPREAIDELANLQRQAPGMHPALARAQFKGSCGRYPEQVFRQFGESPFAAASLGQVHRAVTRRGEKAAVKIQYPAIRTAIDNDLKILRSATLPGRITGHAPAGILDEMERGFMEETDYINEGKNIDFFREHLKGFPYLTIPKVYWDLTTDRVLTMSFVEGETVGPFLESRPSQAMRDLIGRRLFELFQFQVLHLHVLHADPHPGNYLFQGDGRIGLVDFGCVKRFSPDVAELSRYMVDRVWKQGDRQLQRMMGLLWGRDVALRKVRKMLAELEELADILFPLPGKGEPLVDFGKPALLNALGRNLRRAVQDKLTNPEFAFISRSELGLHNLLHQLRARVNTREVWRRVAGRQAKTATET